MIDDQLTAENVLINTFGGIDTPAPWDVDPDCALWVLEWYTGDVCNGLCADVGGTYTVAINDGEDVRTFGGIIEALAWVRKLDKEGVFTNIETDTTTTEV